MTGITILNPVAINRVEARAAAPRIASLKGARLGLLNNNKPNAEKLLEHLGQQIAKSAGVGEIVTRQKPNPAVGAEALEAFAAEVSAVITAIGD